MWNYSKFSKACFLGGKVRQMAFQDMGMGSKFFGHQFLKMPIFLNLRTIGYQRQFSQANYDNQVIWVGH